ncbi:hypothetical protein TNIN_417731 [Trichonephila inaurata madagascariensis]|uniref:Uncharacterized protein n=1 Tax=Trichonephila inaurata madagascariensis TaxID=2747483 RepID=A0A8X7CI77_9ARAC|nr:hypothetical protein TNIN_417731 [Trichonephila inaurata madagascariensis]
MQSLSAWNNRPPTTAKSMIPCLFFKAFDSKTWRLQVQKQLPQKDIAGGLKMGRNSKKQRRRYKMDVAIQSVQCPARECKYMWTHYYDGIVPTCTGTQFDILP